MRKEERLQISISRYLKHQYPQVIFTAESSGIPLPIYLAKKAKAQRNPTKGLPDVWIAQPNTMYYGLFLELKTKTPFLKSGKLSTNKHIREQAKVLERLNDLGYLAQFVWSFDMAKALIDDYLKNG